MSLRTQPTAPMVGESRPRLDPWLSGAALFLVGLGLMMILSASSVRADDDYANPMHFLVRQMFGLAAGAVGGFAILVAPWRHVRASARWTFAIVGLALALVIPFGHEVNGAKRWISLGPVNVQPSEFSKLALVMIFGDYLSNNVGRMRDILGVVVPGLGALVAYAALVFFQQDLGTIVILIALTAVAYLVAGLDLRWMGLLGVLAAVPVGLLVISEPWRVARVLSFLDPFQDAQGQGYQVVQGWIALASGGLWGAGFVGGQAQHGFLPEAHTDFIIAVIGEEFGVVGVLATLYAYLVVVWRGVTIAEQSRDMFRIVVASGITALLAAQTIVNVGVVFGLMPAKGLVLPFLSYGASAAIVHSWCVAWLLRIGLENGREAALDVPSLR
jgi:cell division protein FtsW